MSDSPNTSPSFIQSCGIIGYPAELTNQVCARDNPGSIPVIVYDPTASYAQGNGALVESIDIQGSGVTAASVLLLFYRLMEDPSPKWRKAGEVALPAVAAVSPTAVMAGYPVEFPLKNILSPVPHAGTTTQFRGLRLNSPERPTQWGVALTVAVGTAPIVVTMYGGEY